MPPLVAVVTALIPPNEDVLLNPSVPKVLCFLRRWYRYVQIDITANWANKKTVPATINPISKQVRDVFIVYMNWIEFVVQLTDRINTETLTVWWHKDSLTAIETRLCLLVLFETKLICYLNRLHQQKILLTGLFGASWCRCCCGITSRTGWWCTCLIYGWLFFTTRILIRYLFYVLCFMHCV